MGILEYLLGDRPDHSNPSIQGSLGGFVIEQRTAIEGDDGEIHAAEVSGDRRDQISFDESFPDGQRSLELSLRDDGDEVEILFNCPDADLEIRGEVAKGEIIAEGNGNVFDRMIRFDDDQERATIVVQRSCIIRVNDVRLKLSF